MPTRAEVRADVLTLLGSDANISTAELNTIITQRYDTLYNGWLWPRRLRDFTITLVPQINSTATNTVTVTNGSATVVSAGTPFTSAMVGRQIRIGAESQYFFVNSFVSSSTITIGDGEGNAVPWPGATASGQTWQIFQTIYALPSDAEGVLSLAGRFEIDEVDGGRARLDWLDPYRNTVGADPLYWCYVGESSAGRREIEVWPVPTTARLLRGQYARSAPTLADATELGLPRTMVVMAVAADAAKMLYAKTGDAAWQGLAVEWERRANEERERFQWLELERLSPARTVGRRRDLSDLARTDFAVDHDTDLLLGWG